MSGTTAGTHAGTDAGTHAAAAAEPSPSVDEVEPRDDSPANADDRGDSGPGDADVGDADASGPGRAGSAQPAGEAELGFAVPTWYVLFCAIPFAAAFLLPITVIYRAQNSVPPMSATSAAWLGVGTGWALWLFGAAGWLLGPVVLVGPRRRSPSAWGWWHRTTRAWTVVVLAWGLVASLSVLAVAVLLGMWSA